MDPGLDTLEHKFVHDKHWKGFSHEQRKQEIQATVQTTACKQKWRRRALATHGMDLSSKTVYTSLLFSKPGIPFPKDGVDAQQQIAARILPGMQRRPSAV